MRATGRHTKDPLRRGGITADTVTTIIKAAAKAAELTPMPTPAELAAEARAKAEAFEAAAAAETAEEANAVIKAWRTAKRATCAAVRRITGHSMRRGCIQALLDAGNPPEVVAVHSRHSPRSAAFDAYRNKQLSWAQNPAATLGLAA
ncbi:hypothetical protein [Kitasatospora sp. NPDC092286]|uniref:hypothetical protein n=1 Tax=Kitasatospora sp. NPDC092286 TaxID=3364087 RepID=UPI0037F20F02